VSMTTAAVSDNSGREAPMVSPPGPTRRLPTRSSMPAGQARPGLVSLLGAHGGAGVSSLLRAGVLAQDAGRAWPPAGPVLIVVRRTAVGLEWARDVARQHASGGTAPTVRLAGLVVVADAPGRTPVRLSRFLDLLSGAYVRLWEVPWVEEWRLAGYAEPLPTPPAVRQLAVDMRALSGAGTDREKE